MNYFCITNECKYKCRNMSIGINRLFEDDGSYITTGLAVEQQRSDRDAFQGGRAGVRKHPFFALWVLHFSCFLVLWMERCDELLVVLPKLKEGNRPI